MTPQTGVSCKVFMFFFLKPWPLPGFNLAPGTVMVLINTWLRLRGLDREFFRSSWCRTPRPWESHESWGKMWCGKSWIHVFRLFSLYILSIDRWSCNFYFESWILKCQQVDSWKHHCYVGRKEATGVSALCPQKSLGWRDVRVELQGFSIRVSNQMKIHVRILPRNSQGKADSGCWLLCHDMVTVRQETLLARLWWQS